MITGLWCLLIFMFSANDAETSSAQSSAITDVCIDVFVSDYKEMTETEQKSLYDKLTFYIRKSAHFTEYAVLGVLVFWCLYKLQDKRLRTACAAVLGSLYSATDELHQLFSDGRSCELRDMLIDTGGVLVGALFGLVVLLIYEKYLARKNLSMLVYNKEYRRKTYLKG